MESFVLGITQDLYQRHGAWMREYKGPPAIVWQPVDFKQADWLEHCPAARLDGLVTRVNLTPADYRRMPRLRLLQVPMAGYEQVNLATAAEFHVAVGCNGGANADSVAEHVILLLLLLRRQWSRQVEQVRSGQWHSIKYQNQELLGATLGIIGLGYCGQALAGKALGLGMRVLAHDIQAVQLPDKWDGQVRLVDRNTVLEQADMISLHVPLTSKTRHMINRDTLSRLRQGALLINTSRGGVVEEAALVQALQSRHIGGAGLDVFENEPLPVDHSLQNLERVVLTPHAAPSAQSEQRLLANIVANVRAVIHNTALPYPARDYERVLEAGC